MKNMTLEKSETIDVGTIINTNTSISGQVLLDWIAADKDQKTAEEQVISSKLYHKYIMDRNGVPKTKIYPKVYYYVNYNNRLNPNVFLAYIVRDKIKSPRSIPDQLVNLNLVGSESSYKGTLIQEWAYYQNNSAQNPYYMEGCEIVSEYLENEYPLKRDKYYYIALVKGKIKIFRDWDKSPKPEDIGYDD